MEAAAKTSFAIFRKCCDGSHHCATLGRNVGYCGFATGEPHSGRSMNTIFSGWFAINILAPFFLPIIGLVALWLLPLGTTASDKLRIMAVVKDGQLCWAGVAMGASSLYKSWVALEAHKEITGGAFLLFLICIMMFPSMTLAAAGGVFGTELLKTSGGGLWAWCAHYKTFVGSLTLSVLTAIAYTYLHSQLS